MSNGPGELTGKTPASDYQRSETFQPASNRGPFTAITQHTVTCPHCGLSSAAHVGRQVDRSPGTLIRFVCPTSCYVSASSVLALIDATAPSIPRPAASLPTGQSA
jgi:hypothetical protein